MLRRTQAAAWAPPAKTLNIDFSTLTEILFDTHFFERFARVHCPYRRDVGKL
jgi:hypothetical protein